MILCTAQWTNTFYIPGYALWKRIWPSGSFGATFILVTPAKTSKKPIKTPPVLLLFSWSCGGQEHPDGVFKGHSWTANGLRIILSFYRPQKASKTPEKWAVESCLKFLYFCPIFWPPLLGNPWFGLESPRPSFENPTKTQARSSPRFCWIFSLRAGALITIIMMTYEQSHGDECSRRRRKQETSDDDNWCRLIELE